MNRLSKLLTTAFLSVAILFAAAAQAKTIRQWDKMAEQDRDDYLTRMIERAQKIFRDASRGDLSQKIDKLFWTTPAGAKMTLGMTEFDMAEALARVDNEEATAKDPNARTFEIEDVIAAVLQKHGVVVPPSFLSVMSDFQPTHPAQSTSTETPLQFARNRLSATREVFAKNGMTLPDSFFSVMNEYKAGHPPTSLGPTNEGQVLDHLIHEATNGFRGLRGEKQGNRPEWESVTTPVGALNCVVNWSDNSSAKVELGCLILQESSKAEARREFLRLRDVIATIVPWKDARHAPPAEDDFRIFFEPHEEGATARSVTVRYKADKKPGQYFVDMTITSAVSPVLARGSAVKDGAVMAGWVAEDIRGYAAAGEKGFVPYRTGAPKVRQDGVRWWESSEKPALAERCEVQQSPKANIFLCVMMPSIYEGELEVTLNEFVSDTQASLPPGWARMDDRVINNKIISNAFYSSNGMAGEIWTAPDSSVNQYRLYFQVLAPRRPSEGTRNAAPSKPAPAPAPNRSTTPDDDPIGEGGFITPYIVPSPE